MLAAVYPGHFGRPDFLPAPLARLRMAVLAVVYP